MQNKNLLKKNFSLVLSLAHSHYVFASTTGGGLLCKPMNQPLNGVVKIPQAHAQNLLSQISLATELVGLWNLPIRGSYIPNYKTAISDEITCKEGEQFPLKKKKSNEKELEYDLESDRCT